MGEDQLWEAVNDLREDRAAFRQAMQDQTKGFDELKQIIKEDVQRGHEVHGAQAIQIAGISKDIDGVGLKIQTVANDLKEHKEGHWKWIAVVLGIPSAVAAIFVIAKSLNG